jgi:hypothetical protein
MTFAHLFNRTYRSYKFYRAYIQGEEYEITNYRIASGERRVRSDGPRAIDAANNTSSGVRGGFSNAPVAKFSGVHRYGQSQHMDVETHSHGVQISEYG